MNLPDPDDPHFTSEVRVTAIYLIGAIAFLLGCACVGIAYLSPAG